MSIIYSQSFLDDIKNKKYNKIFLEKEYPKLVQAGQVHGYRGPSKKRHNGIVPI